MQVTIISKSEEPIKTLYTAARTCYSSSTPEKIFKDILNDTECLKLIKKCIKSGHHSILEHVNITFAIEGISRACSHQLVRHRHCSFSQQSQRYVEIKENEENLKEAFENRHKFKNFKDSTIFKIMNKYFVDVDEYLNLNAYYSALEFYLNAVKLGKKAEEARNFLPNATKTNIVLTCNLRELIHICNERLCANAQKEIRELARQMSFEVSLIMPFLEEFLQPKCEKIGYCPEFKSCGRKKELKK